MNRNKLVLVIIVISVLFIPGCKNKTDNQEKNGAAKIEEQTTTFAVSTTLAVQGEIKDYLELNGDISARSTVDTYADTAGKLKNIYVKVGDAVRENQIIADVDPSRPGMTFAASPVKASISGTVTEVPRQIGSVITPNLSIARISKMDELQVVIYVAERFISKLKIGLPAVIKSEAFPEIVFEGKIREISPVVDKISRTIEVKLRLTDSKKKLKAGMFAKVKLITEEKEGIVKIPSEALINRFGENYVFVIKPDPQNSEKKISEKRLVVTGLRIDNQLEIVNGLEEGEVVIVRGQTLLEDSSPVKVVSTAAPLKSLDTVE
ncbi:MAG: efflux RND transporter periplasmic adaptor subunit [Spirochaetaceae bacterium]|nr:efflux RND transporter periplasmic adaptor subunit [Spirochaetaceae bacterium]